MIPAVWILAAAVPALAASWPEDGPETLWSRSLGDGYSAILVDAGRLYTMYRARGEEMVVCVDADSGETIWERRYGQPLHPRHLSGYGDAPRSTPAISGDLMFSIGMTGRLLALNKREALASSRTTHVANASRGRDPVASASGAGHRVGREVQSARKARSVSVDELTRSLARAFDSI